MNGNKSFQSWLSFQIRKTKERVAFFERKAVCDHDYRLSCDCWRERLATLLSVKREYKQIMIQYKERRGQ